MYWRLASQPERQEHLAEILSQSTTTWMLCCMQLPISRRPEERNRHALVYRQPGWEGGRGAKLCKNHCRYAKGQDWVLNCSCFISCPPSDCSLNRLKYNRGTAELAKEWQKKVRVNLWLYIRVLHPKRSSTAPRQTMSNTKNNQN